MRCRLVFSVTRESAREAAPVNISIAKIAKIAKKASPPKPEFPLFPIAQIPSVARLRIGRCPDRIVRVDKLELRSELSRRDEWETREKVSFFQSGQSAPRRFAPNRIIRFAMWRYNEIFKYKSRVGTSQLI